MSNESVVYVDKTTELPFLYIPYGSVEAALRKHPDSKLYVFRARAPKGYQIVAYPILMEEPKEGEEEVVDGG